MTTNNKADVFKGFPILSEKEFEKIDRSARRAIGGVANLLIRMEEERNKREAKLK